MGCDIHLHIEVLVKGEWLHYGAPNVGRWYRLFGAMAGVRSLKETPISPPKGFPEDASIVTKLIRAHDGADGHSDSWLSHDEIMQLEDRLRRWEKEDPDPTLDPFRNRYDLEAGVLHTYLAGSGFTAHWRYDDIRYLPEGIDDVRFVFWFDN